MGQPQRWWWWWCSDSLRRLIQSGRLMISGCQHRRSTRRRSPFQLPCLSRRVSTSEADWDVSVSRRGKRYV